MIRRKIRFSNNSDIPFSQKEIVFVSYRHIDKEKCLAVLDQLKKVSYAAVWTDQNLSAGEYFDNEIEEAMLLSNVMVQVVTEHYFSEGSYTMDRELPLAKKIGLPVISVICGNVSEEVSVYVRMYADYICNLQDPNSIIDVFDDIHERIQDMGLLQNFFRLIKRINTWYLTPEEMYELACGFLRLRESGEIQLIAPGFTEDVAKRYARAAKIAGIAGADTLLKMLEGNV